MSFFSLSFATTNWATGLSLSRCLLSYEVSIWEYLLPDEPDQHDLVEERAYRIPCGFSVKSLVDLELIARIVESKSQKFATKLQ